MATIGHTLVGLGLTPGVGGKGRGWPSMAWWPGALILGSHMPDIAEWGLMIAGLQNERTHQFHTYKGVIALMLGGWAAMMLLGVRNLVPLLIWAGAVWSHLLLDNAQLGHEIRSWYRDPPSGTDIAARGLDPAAEIWFFGGLVVTTGLVTAALASRARLKVEEYRQAAESSALTAGARDYDSAANPRAGAERLRMRSALCLIPLVVIAWFLPGIRWLWVLVYILAGIAALWSRGVEPRLVWLCNLIPLAPVIGLGAVEIWSGILTQRAAQLEFMRDFDQATALYRKSATLPTRSDRAIRWWGVGRCCERAGDVTGAETAYKTCVESDVEWHWSRLILARLYLRPDTPLYKPAAAERLLMEVLAAKTPDYVRAPAQQILKAMRGS